MTEAHAAYGAVGAGAANIKSYPAPEGNRKRCDLESFLVGVAYKEVVIMQSGDKKVHRYLAYVI